MAKLKIQFNDHTMQLLYEALRYDGKSLTQARKETIRRFNEYDAGSPLSIFYKKG